MVSRLLQLLWEATIILTCLLYALIVCLAIAIAIPIAVILGIIVTGIGQLMRAAR